MKSYGGIFKDAYTKGIKERNIAIKYRIKEGVLKNGF